MAPRLLVQIVECVGGVSRRAGISRKESKGVRVNGRNLGTVQMLPSG
jgi:hypothetical protein